MPSPAPQLLDLGCKIQLFIEFSCSSKDEGIVMHNTIVRTPQQNGVAERKNRTLVERTRCMLSNAGVGKELWAEAINTACYLAFLIRIRDRQAFLFEKEL